MKYVITENTACTVYVMTSTLILNESEDGFYGTMKPEEFFKGKTPHHFNTQKEAIQYCKDYIKLYKGEDTEITEWDNKTDDQYEVSGGCNMTYFEIIPVPEDILKYTFYVNENYNGKILITCRETGICLELPVERHVKGDPIFCMVFGDKKDKHISDELGVFNLVFRGCKIEGRITYRQDFHTPISFTGVPE